MNIPSGAYTPPELTLDACRRRDLAPHRNQCKTLAPPVIAAPLSNATPHTECKPTAAWLSSGKRKPKPRLETLLVFEKYGDGLAKTLPNTRLLNYGINFSGKGVKREYAS